MRWSAVWDAQMVSQHLAPLPPCPCSLQTPAPLASYLSGSLITQGLCTDLAHSLFPKAAFNDDSQPPGWRFQAWPFGSRDHLGHLLGAKRTSRKALWYLTGVSRMSGTDLYLYYVSGPAPFLQGVVQVSLSLGGTLRPLWGELYPTPALAVSFLLFSRSTCNFSQILEWSKSGLFHLILVSSSLYHPHQSCTCPSLCCPAPALVIFAPHMTVQARNVTLQ